MAVELSPAQLEAARAVERWYAGSTAREFYLAGYAGTGKSTVAAALIRHFQAHGLTVEVGAFTGKAAAVLRRKGLGDARTLHSLIYVPVEGSDPVRFELSRDSDLAAADLLVIDEVSMVGSDLAADLRSFGKKILVLGDPGQLPPIRGAGAFTSREPDAFLSKIHRQAVESPILRLATKARSGEPITDADGDGFVVRVARLTMTEVLAARARGAQLVCGTHRARWAITRRIREMELKKNRRREAWLPLAGERLVCLRNDRDRGIFNGELGTVLEVLDDGADDDEDRPFLRIAMDDDGPTVEGRIEAIPFREHYEGRLIAPPFRGTLAFDFGYALTCHKSQGSEWPDVAVIDDSAAFGEDRHRWLYTAVTRAVERLTLLARGGEEGR